MFDIIPRNETTEGSSVIFGVPLLSHWGSNAMRPVPLALTAVNCACHAPYIAPGHSPSSQDAPICSESARTRPCAPCVSAGYSLRNATPKCILGSASAPRCHSPSLSAHSSTPLSDHRHSHAFIYKCEVRRSGKSASLRQPSGTHSRTYTATAQRHSGTAACRRHPAALVCGPRDKIWVQLRHVNASRCGSAVVLNGQ